MGLKRGENMVTLRKPWHIKDDVANGVVILDSMDESVGCIIDREVARYICRVVNKG